MKITKKLILNQININGLILFLIKNRFLITQNTGCYHGIPKSSFQYSSAKFSKVGRTADKVFNFSDDIQKAVVLAGLFFESKISSDFDLEAYQEYERNFIIANSDAHGDTKDIDFIDIIQKAFDLIKVSTRPSYIDELKSDHKRAGAWYDVDIHQGEEENIRLYKYLHHCIGVHQNKLVYK